jgi:hypothetical protein
MNSLDDMSASDAIVLYYEKHDALLHGDIIRLLELKNKYPEIFDKEKDEKIRDMIDYCKAFQATDRYKELGRMQVKETLFIVQNEKIKNE